VPAGTAASAAPELEVVVEVPRGSFLKRSHTDRIACEGWIDARDEIARARPRDASWHEPPVDF